MKMLSIFTIIRLILLAVMLSIFFACSSSGETGLSLQEFKQKEGETPGKASEAYWAIPEQYKNVPIEQIKSQIEITDYMTMKGAATNAGTENIAVGEGYKSLVKGGGAIPDETPKNKADREALATYTNKLISLEGVFDTVGTQKTSPMAITEREPGKYEIWFCDKTRKPCRYQAFLLYIGPEGKGDTLFTKDNRIRFWGVVLEEKIRKLFFSGEPSWRRYPKIRVLDLEVIK